MSVLRLILAGLIALAAMVAVAFAALLVLASGLFAFVLQLFGVRKHEPRPAAPPASGRQPRVMRDDDAIDVEATKVPTDRTES